MSTETGQNEVYVRPFPAGDGKWQVSASGGVYPRWRQDGKELFYFSAQIGGKVMSSIVNGAGPRFERGTPQELFDSGKVVGSVLGHQGNSHPYAVSPDGQRFLIPRLASNLQGEAPPTPITVILNWTAALKK